jgi:hypothetical protein
MQQNNFDLSYSSDNSESDDLYDLSYQNFIREKNVNYKDVSSDETQSMSHTGSGENTPQDSLSSVGSFVSYTKNHEEESLFDYTYNPSDQSDTNATDSIGIKSDDVDVIADGAKEKIRSGGRKLSKLRPNLKLTQRYDPTWSQLCSDELCESPEKDYTTDSENCSSRNETIEKNISDSNINSSEMRDETTTEENTTIEENQCLSGCDSEMHEPKCENLSPRSKELSRLLKEKDPLMMKACDIMMGRMMQGKQDSTESIFIKDESEFVEEFSNSKKSDEKFDAKKLVFDAINAIKQEEKKFWNNYDEKMYAERWKKYWTNRPNHLEPTNAYWNYWIGREKDFNNTIGPDYVSTSFPFDGTNVKCNKCSFTKFLPIDWINWHDHVASISKDDPNPTPIEFRSCYNCLSRNITINFFPFQQREQWLSLHTKIQSFQECC